MYLFGIYEGGVKSLRPDEEKEIFSFFFALKVFG